MRGPATIGWGLRFGDPLSRYISQWLAQFILSRAVAGGAHDMALFRIGTVATWVHGSAASVASGGAAFTVADDAGRGSSSRSGPSSGGSYGRGSA